MVNKFTQIVLFLFIGLVCEGKIEFECVFFDFKGYGLNSEEYEWMKPLIREACAEIGDWVEQEAKLLIYFCARTDCKHTNTLAMAYSYMPDKQSGLPGLELVESNAIAHGVRGRKDVSNQAGLIDVYVCKKMKRDTSARFKELIKHEVTHLMGMTSRGVTNRCYGSQLSQYTSYDRLLITQEGLPVIDESSYWMGARVNEEAWNCTSPLYFNGTKVREVFGEPVKVYHDSEKFKGSSSYVHTIDSNACLAMMSPNIQRDGSGKWNELEAAMMMDLGWKVKPKAVHHCYETIYVDHFDTGKLEHSLELEVKSSGTNKSFNPLFKEEGKNLEYVGTLESWEKLQFSIYCDGHLLFDFKPGGPVAGRQKKYVWFEVDETFKCFNVGVYFVPLDIDKNKYVLRCDVYRDFITWYDAQAFIYQVKDWVSAQWSGFLGLVKKPKEGKVVYSHPGMESGEVKLYFSGGKGFWREVRDEFPLLVSFSHAQQYFLRLVVNGEFLGEISIASDRGDTAIFRDETHDCSYQVLWDWGDSSGSDSNDSNRLSVEVGKLSN